MNYYISFGAYRYSVFYSTCDFYAPTTRYSKSELYSSGNFDISFSGDMTNTEVDIPSNHYNRQNFNCFFYMSNRSRYFRV